MAILQEWRKFKDWLARNVPIYHERLNGPATLEELKALEAELGVELPEDFKQLYMENNGERPGDFIGGSMLGLTFLSLQQISYYWKRDVVTGHERNMPPSPFMRSVQPGYVQDLQLHRKWIPVFTDTQGDYLGYDFFPGEKGRPGQFINFGVREYQHCVIAEDLTGVLELINAQLKARSIKKAIFKHHDGNKVIFGLVKEGHLTDDLVRLTKQRVSASQTEP